MLITHTLPLTFEFASTAHLRGLERLNIANAISPPTFENIQQLLQEHSQWKLVHTTHELSSTEFFTLLAQRKFPFINELRPIHEVFCGSKPDYWHEVVGHIALLFDKNFADFYQNMAKLYLTLLASNQDTKAQHLQQVLWILFEYGFIKENNQNKAFGAAIVGSALSLLRLKKNVLAVEPFYPKVALDSGLYDEHSAVPRNPKGQIRMFAIESIQIAELQILTFFK